MEPRIRDLETLYKGLADATRLRIVGLLAGGEVCVCHIHQSLRLPQPTVSRHLAYLRRHGLVDTRRDGLWVHYRLARPADSTIRAALEAAAHAVGHVPATRSDEGRLARRVTRPSERRLLPMLSCCAGDE
jgi:ArsR family transcriptional regulator